MPAASVLRARSGVHAVTNIEVFFDLVYAFAVTQLSHYLLDHATPEGALALLIPVSLRLPALVVSAIAVAVVALVVIRDRSHKIDEATLEARLVGVR